MLACAYTRALFTIFLIAGACACGLGISLIMWDLKQVALRPGLSAGSPTVAADGPHSENAEVADDLDRSSGSLGQYQFLPRPYTMFFGS